MGTVANSNLNFKGTVSSADLPQLFGRPALYSVDGKDALKVTAGGAGDRAVTVAPGNAWGDAVLSKWTTGAVLNAAANTTLPTRWDTVVIRRTWTPAGTPTGTATLMILTGGSSAAIAPGRLTDRGVTSSDQPIALVPIAQNAALAGAPIDLRVWTGEGGGLVAEHVAALQYLGSKGTSVKIGTTTHTRMEDSSGTLYWAKSGLVDAEPPFLLVARSTPFSGPISTGPGTNFYAGQSNVQLGNAAASFGYSYGASTLGDAAANPARITFTESGLYAFGCRMAVTTATSAAFVLSLKGPGTDGTSPLSYGYAAASIPTEVSLSDTRYVAAGRSWTPAFGASQPITVSSWSMWVTRIG